MVKLLILITLWRGNKPYLLVGKLQINKDILIYLTANVLVGHKSYKIFCTKSAKTSHRGPENIWSHHNIYEDQLKIKKKYSEVSNAFPYKIT